VNPKQIEDLALEPVCRRPNARDAVDAAVGRDFQTHALVVRNGKQVVDNFERRVEVIRVMNASQIGKVVELSFVV
jgi:hypothetical protein